MAAPKPIQEVLLSPAVAILQKAVRQLPAACQQLGTLQILEAAATTVAGFDYDWYKEAAGVRENTIVDVKVFSGALLRELKSVAVPLPLALAALARPPYGNAERRSKGAYFTDFRLARYLAEPLAGGPEGRSIMDPSCGTGTLLVAAVQASSEAEPRKVDSILAECVFGFDLSGDAIRGAMSALCSMARSRSVVPALREHLNEADAFETSGPKREFDVVIGNPPWERLKLSRHEYLTGEGADRHYGEDYEHLDHADLMANRDELRRYGRSVGGQFVHQGRGERDLYKLFLELAIKLTKAGGLTLFLVPAGLIRSQGTQALREFLFRNCSEIDFTVLDNHARFFEIDTRFKFLAMRARTANGHATTPLNLMFAKGEKDRIGVQRAVAIERNVLRAVRPDLTLPEVRTRAEWELFTRITRNGVRLGSAEGPWQPNIVREVDMTQDRKFFERAAGEGRLPVIEGRMVHQFEFNAKGYESGTGRRAMWRAVSAARRGALRPQFWYPAAQLSASVGERVRMDRYGFCDITGQTNERSLLASRIPHGTVCGNKVPTIVFCRELGWSALGDCWLAIANSFCFDWMLRRVVTTTVNFFLLLDLAMPPMDPKAKPGRQLAKLAERISAVSAQANSAIDAWQVGHWRAEIEVEVAEAYSLSFGDLRLILEDFRLLDRSQPAIRGEVRSTVTRDLALLRVADVLGGCPASEHTKLAARVEEARRLGATPYVPPRGALPGI